jgi:hypothetical protein
MGVYWGLCCSICGKHEILTTVFIGVCVAQFVGNMKYLPPVFIGVCVAQFLGNTNSNKHRGKYFMFATN